MRDLGILEDLLNTLSVTIEQIKGLYVNGTNGTEEFGRSLVKQRIEAHGFSSAEAFVIG